MAKTSSESWRKTGFLKHLRTATILGAAVAAIAGPASAAGTLRIGMTASDIPLTTGQTDQGGEGSVSWGIPFITP